MRLHIISWNIWFGTYLDKITDFLVDSNADIIGLQEVTQTPDGRNNIAESLSEKLRYSYTYATGMDLRSYGKQLVMGNAILSRFPIVRKSAHILSRTDSRVAVGGDIQVDGKILHVFCTHLLHTHQQPSKIQEEQAGTLVSVLPIDHAIVMGDFNATPDSAAIQIMRNALKKVDGDSIKPTWSVYPSGCVNKECVPKGVTIRLDYIFTTKDIHTKAFEIQQSDGSDHLPISLVIEL